MAYEEKNGIFEMTHYKTETLDLRLMDCMELMRETPDKFYDLAVVDPPYGIGAADDKRGGKQHGKSAARQRAEAFLKTLNLWKQ